MSTIILPSRWRRQPTDGRLILAPSNQIAEGITAFFDPFTMRFGGSSPYGNATTPRYSPDGVAADVAITGSKFAEWSHDPRFAITGDISIGVVFDVDALGNYSGLVAKQATSTTYAPFELRAGSGVTDSNFEFLRATSGSYKSWAGSGNRLSSGQRNVRFMVTAPSGIENSATGYLNGIEFALSTGSGAGSGAAQDNGASKLRIGTRADGATFLDGGIYLVCLWNRRLSSAEAIEWTQAPYQIFGKPKRILYFTAPSGGGATIAGDSLTHAHSLSSPSLTQANVLAVQGASQAHSLGAPALTQHNVLAVNAIAQAHALGNVTLTQAHILTVQGIGQAHSLGAPSLTQHNALTPAPLTQAQTLGNITLTIAGSIAAADIAQGHSIGTPALTQHNILAVAALMQAQSLGQPALSQAGTLAVQGMTQAQVLDAVTLAQHHALAVQALLQGHALGSITLTASDALAIDGLTHAQILGSPSLTQHNVLAVQNMTHAQILQAVTLGGLVIGSLRGTLVAYSLIDGEVVCRALLSGSLETVH